MVILFLTLDEQNVFSHHYHHETKNKTFCRVDWVTLIIKLTFSRQKKRVAKKQKMKCKSKIGLMITMDKKLNGSTDIKKLSISWWEMSNEMHLESLTKKCRCMFQFCLFFLCVCSFIFKVCKSENWKTETRIRGKKDSVKTWVLDSTD